MTVGMAEVELINVDLLKMFFKLQLLLQLTDLLFFSQLTIQLQLQLRSVTTVTVVALSVTGTASRP